jgi:hypothetical protein
VGLDLGAAAPGGSHLLLGEQLELVGAVRRGRLARVAVSVEDHRAHGVGELDRRHVAIPEHGVDALLVRRREVDDSEDPERVARTTIGR